MDFFFLQQATTPDEHSLERLKVEANLEDALGNPQRPTKEELLEQGIYLDTTPQELQMSVRGQGEGRGGGGDHHTSRDIQSYISPNADADVVRSKC